MRPRVAVAGLLLATLTGCSGGGQEDAAAAPVGSTAAKASTRPGAAPRTAADFLARAERATAGEKGWTFAVRGREALLAQGQENAATYAATVHRTTRSPWALHSTGTTHREGTDSPEEIYVVDGTAYVKEGGTGTWRHGPLTDPEYANKVEDPVAVLDAFRTYTGDDTPGGGVSLVTSGGGVELRVRTAKAALPAVRERGVVRRAVRELAPTLKQLRANGVAAPDARITVESAEESLVLDPSTYRITSHTFRCVFLVPYGGGGIRYSQEVTERNQGAYAGGVALLDGVGRG
ncbi:hypothetical protein ACFYWX_06740 [Streptomyces sp. NPDC002888]|uniref:hypothetical protein n=1 Tax=Streptomyces sp. NPDC002888 TaxID=3364668 RepID=UPI00367E22D5